MFQNKTPWNLKHRYCTKKELQNSSGGATNPLLKSKFQSSKSVFILTSRIMLCQVNTFMPPLHETRIKSNGFSPQGSLLWYLEWIFPCSGLQRYIQSKKLFLSHSLASYFTTTLRNTSYDQLLKGIPDVNKLSNSVLGGFKGLNEFSLDTYYKFLASHLSLTLLTDCYLQ